MRCEKYGVSDVYKCTTLYCITSQRTVVFIFMDSTSLMLIYSLWFSVTHWDRL
jgi:hypothetical protein